MAKPKSSSPRLPRFLICKYIGQPYVLSTSLLRYTKYMGWSFARINGRLAEIFFDREEDETEPKIIGHCYVSASEYKTKREQKWIEKDTERYQFSYLNKIYRDKIRKKVLQRSDPREKS